MSRDARPNMKRNDYCVYRSCPCSLCDVTMSSVFPCIPSIRVRWNTVNDSKVLPQSQPLSSFYINALSRPSSSPLQTRCCSLTASTHTIAKPHHSESLLVIHKLLFLTLGRNLKAFLGRVQDQLDLLDQAILLLLDLRVFFDSLLDE